MNTKTLNILREYTPQTQKERALQLTDFLLNTFTPQTIQVFNTRNLCNDKLTTIYKDNEMQVDYDPIHYYLEIFGVPEKTYDFIHTILDPLSYMSKDDIDETIEYYKKMEVY